MDKLTQDVATSDIVLSAYLKCLGYQLDRIEKQGSRGIFHFLDIPEQLLSDFDLGKAQIDPVAFNSCIKSLTTATRRVT